MAVFEYPSDHLFLVFLFHLLGMIYPSLKRKYGSCPGWFSPEPILHTTAHTTLTNNTTRIHGDLRLSHREQRAGAVSRGTSGAVAPCGRPAVPPR